MFTHDTIDVQKRIRRWVDMAREWQRWTSHERGMRSLEENLELAQTLGVSWIEAYDLWEHVHAKPVGVIEQELGGSTYSPSLELTEPDIFLVSVRIRN